MPDASPIRPRRAGDDWAWLRTHPPLSELIERFPQQWTQCKADVGALLERDDADEIATFIKVTAVAAPARPGARLAPIEERVRVEAQRQMTVQVLKDRALRASTGVAEGRVRFGLVNGYVAQKLLFRRDLERKPVRIGLFRMVWPLLRQRKLLMPLVRSRGIWCFYSSALVDELADLIAGRRTVEIAAGDGTLSRFLADAGVDIVATDDHSWDDSIAFPDDVQRLDARTALRELRPEVVVCSWPPAGNTFEQHVFRTPSVQMYILITSASELSAGNWAAYRAQSEFEMALDERLTRLVLPPEVKYAVHVFRRRSTD